MPLKNMHNNCIKKKEWMTDEILDMMEEIRNYKNKDPTKLPKLPERECNRGAFCHLSYSTYTLKKSLEKQSTTLDMPTTQ